MGRSACIAFVAFIFAVIPGIIFAVDVPTPDEVNRVFEFYDNGKGEGVVMRESKLCEDIHREGSLKYECKNEIIELGEMKADGSAPDITYKISKGEGVYIWMAYMVPMGAVEEIFLRYNFGGETKRTSKKSTVKGSQRYRTWKKFTPPTKGTWEIEIFNDKASGPVKLSSYELIVE